MKALISNGLVTLENIRVDEVRLLHTALEVFTLECVEHATTLEIEAGRKLEAVRGRRHGKTAATRVAGELRNQAAGLRASAREGADLLRALGWAATHKDAR